MARANDAVVWHPADPGLFVRNSKTVKQNLLATWNGYNIQHELHETAERYSNSLIGISTNASYRSCELQQPLEELGKLSMGFSTDVDVLIAHRQTRSGGGRNRALIPCGKHTQLLLHSVVFVFVLQMELACLQATGGTIPAQTVR